MIQDYHLFLALADAAHDASRSAHRAFHAHALGVADYMAMLPDDVAYAIVDGLLGADVIGFHTNRWAQLFRQTLRRSRRARPLKACSRSCLGVDGDELTKRAWRRDVESELRALHETHGERRLIGRCRPHRAVEERVARCARHREFLRTHPEWHGKVVHVVYNNPSREDLPARTASTRPCCRGSRRAVDDEFSTDDWSPVFVEIVDDYPAALAVLRRSDVVFINSVRDGMNLVVLEGLVLSNATPRPCCRRRPARRTPWARTRSRSTRST